MFGRLLVRQELRRKARATVRERLGCRRAWAPLSPPVHRDYDRWGGDPASAPVGVASTRSPYTSQPRGVPRGAGAFRYRGEMAPRVGLEPTPRSLIVTCSTDSAIDDRALA